MTLPTNLEAYFLGKVKDFEITNWNCVMNDFPQMLTPEGRKKKEKVKNKDAGDVVVHTKGRGQLKKKCFLSGIA